MIELSADPIVQISDLHAGSAVGLCPPNLWLTESEVTYSLNTGQQWLYERWSSFWSAVQSVAGRRYSVIIVGDLTEGLHHGGTQLISRSAFDHCAAASSLIHPIAKHHTVYVVGGTPAHAGECRSNENATAVLANARALRSVPGIAWFQWGDYIVQAAHHIGTSTSPVSELTALCRLLTKAFGASGRWQQNMPDLIMRAHRHRAAIASLPFGRGRSATCVVSGAWQLPTTYSEKIETIEPSQVGGWVHLPDRLGIRSIPLLWTPWDSTPRPIAGCGSSKRSARPRRTIRGQRPKR